MYPVNFPAQSLHLLQKGWWLLQVNIIIPGPHVFTQKREEMSPYFPLRAARNRTLKRVFFYATLREKPLSMRYWSYKVKLDCRNNTYWLVKVCNKNGNQCLWKNIVCYLNFIEHQIHLSTLSLSSWTFCKHRERHHIKYPFKTICSVNITLWLWRRISSVFLQDPSGSSKQSFSSYIEVFQWFMW